MPRIRRGDFRWSEHRAQFFEGYHRSVAAFADAGSLWNYVGPTTFPATGEVISGSLCSTPPCPVDNAMHIRSSVGVGLIWDSPFGPLRFDYSFPLSKQSYDQVQQFRFGGGTKF